MQGANARGAQRRLGWWLAWWLAGLAGLLVLGGLAAGHRLLDSAWLQERLTPQPGLSIRWDQARFGWPGRLSVEALELRRDDPALPLHLVVESATLEISLPALLGRRLAIRSLEAEGLRTLTLGEHRLSGQGRLSLAGFDLAQGRIGVERLTLDLDDARLLRGDQPLAEEIGLAATLRVAPFVPGEDPGQAAVGFLSGELELAARADAWDLFNPYLREFDWLALAGHGRLGGRIVLERGVLAPGTELVLDSPSLAVTLDEAALLAGGADDGPPSSPALPGERFRIAGAGRVTAAVEEHDAEAPGRLSIDLDDVDMRQEHRDAAFLASRRFSLAAHLPVDLAADLTETSRTPPRARLRWEGAELFDIGVLARYLPPGFPLELRGGRARVDIHLDHDAGRLQGDVALSGRDVALGFSGQAVHGDLQLDLALVELDPRAPRLDLSGTRLRVDARGLEEEPPLSLDLTFHEALFSSRVPLEDLADHPAPPPLDGRLAVSGRLDRLGALDAFLRDALGGRGIGLEGGGELDARLALDGGLPVSGSRLGVTSDALSVALPDVTVAGRGRLDAEWVENDSGPRIHLTSVLDEAGVVRRGDDARLLSDARLRLWAEGTPPPRLQNGDTVVPDVLRLEWEGATLPNVAVLASYLPGAAPVSLSGGRAASHGRLTLRGERASGALHLAGQRIAGTLFGEAVEGELELDLALRDASLDGQSLDLSGTRLTLAASASGADPGERLGSVLIAREARFTRLREPASRTGRLVLEGMVDRLGFLDPFLPREHGLAIRGHGLLSADLRLRGDLLLPESRLTVDAESLEVSFLDYRALGRGRLSARVEGSDAAPGARLAFALPRFTLGRKDEERAWLTGRHLALETATPRFRPGAEALDVQSFVTEIRLPIVEVPDLGLYNAYLPENAGLELLGGQAGLEAALTLEGMRARGDLSLRAFGADLRLADQRLTGDLLLETRLRDGDLAERRFDASGSLLRLDNISRHGAAGRQDAGWWARLDLDEGRLTWTQPLRVDARLSLAMRDSGLLARLFLAGARERDWLGRRLTVPGIRGEARLGMDETGLRLSDARLSGGSLALQADLAMHDESLTGSLYARLGALGLGIALEDGETRLRLLRPQRWFEQRERAAREEETMVEVSPEEWRGWPEE